MRHLYFLLFCLLFSCQGSNKVPDKSISKHVQLQKNRIVIKNLEYLVVDTTTQLQDKYFNEVDSTFFGFKEYLMHVSFGSDNGYVVFSNGEEFMVALVKGDNEFKVKVIGITRIEGIKDDEEFTQLIYPYDSLDNKIFGIIKLVNDKVVTIKAWKVGSKKRFEQLVPSTVDFTESYYTDKD